MSVTDCQICGVTVNYSEHAVRKSVRKCKATSVFSFSGKYSTRIPEEQDVTDSVERSQRILVARLRRESITVIEKDDMVVWFETNGFPPPELRDYWRFSVALSKGCVRWEKVGESITISYTIEFKAFMLFFLFLWLVLATFLFFVMNSAGFMKALASLAILSFLPVTNLLVARSSFCRVMRACIATMISDRPGRRGHTVSSKGSSKLRTPR